MVNRSTVYRFIQLLKFLDWIALDHIPFPTIATASPLITSVVEGVFVVERSLASLS